MISSTGQMWFYPVLAALVLLMACGDDDDSPLPNAATPLTEETSALTPTATRSESPCPADPGPCDALTLAATALQNADIDTLVSLSANQTVACDTVEPSVYVDCFDAETAEGYAIDAGDNMVALLAEEQYRSFLSLLEQVARESSDERGTGDVEVYGVGTEGAAYELLATALIDDLLGPGAPTRYIIVLTFEELEETWALVHFFMQPVNVLVAQGVADPYFDLSENVQPWVN